VALNRGVDRPDRRHREREGHGNPREPLLEQAREASATMDQHREVATQQKEERHAEAVDDEEQQRQQAARPRVVHRPWGLAEGQARVHGDAERHRESTEGVEVGAAFGHGMVPAGLDSAAGPNRLCCDRFSGS
jgi:hypothetical protein